MLPFAPIQPKQGGPRQNTRIWDFNAAELLLVERVPNDGYGLQVAERPIAGREVPGLRASDRPLSPSAHSGLALCSQGHKV